MWRRSPPLLPAGTLATAVPDLADVWNGVLPLFVESLMMVKLPLIFMKSDALEVVK